MQQALLFWADNKIPLQPPFSKGEVRSGLMRVYREKEHIGRTGGPEHVDKNASGRKEEPPPLSAKITPPILCGIQPRLRLFTLLAEGAGRPVTWISAPGGSGKTTLVKSWLDSMDEAEKRPLLWYNVDEGDGDPPTFFYYLGLAAKKASPRHKKPLPRLTPEYLLGIKTFTRNYFEDLYGRLVGRGLLPATIVFDNFQDVPPDSRFHELMAQALDIVPEGIKIIIISRMDPPAGLIRLRANKRMHLIEWEDIRFTPEEAEEFISSHAKKELPREVMLELHRRADGWAAGMLLMAEGASRDVAICGRDSRGMEDIFSYFAGEVLNKADDATRKFLIKTSFLKEMTPTAAESLTSDEKASDILDGLCRNNFFVERHLEGYRYHPLFQEFLLNEALKRFSSEKLSAIRRDAASILIESGRYEEAAVLFRDAGEWEGLTKIILSNAPSLISQGRFKTIGEWISWLPEEVVEKDPWLLYWTGVCRLAFDPAGARGLFEKAYLLFKQCGDLTAQSMTWPLIVDSIAYERRSFKPLDHWINEMEELVTGLPEFPSKVEEMRFVRGILTALCHRRPHHLDLPKWLERGWQLVISEKDLQARISLGTQLVLCHSYIIDFRQASFVIGALMPALEDSDCDPIVMQLWYAQASRYFCFEADWEGCKKNIDEALKIGEKNGIHLLDAFVLMLGACSAISLDKIGTADAFINRIGLMKELSLGDRSYYYLNKAYLAWVRGDMKRAVENAELAVEIVDKMNWPFPLMQSLTGLGVIYFDAGMVDEAERVMRRTMDLCRGLEGFEFGAAMSWARFAFDQGREEEGLLRLRYALARGAKAGMMNFLEWRNEHMARLCAIALKHGIETEYVKRLVAKRGLKLAEASLHPVLVKIREWIGRNLSSSFTLAVAAKANGTSVSHLSRLYKNELAVTFTDDVNRMRIERAKELLSSTDDSNDRIREAVGYDTPQHFFSQFKKMTGKTPREYRLSPKNS